MAPWSVKDLSHRFLPSSRTLHDTTCDKRLAWTACQVFLGLNGEWVEASQDARFDLVIALASGAIDNVDQIAERLRTWRSSRLALAIRRASQHRRATR